MRRFEPDLLSFCAASDNNGATMKTARALSLLLDLILLAAGIATTGPISRGILAVALVVAVVIGGLVVFCAVVLTVAVVQGRQPPYRI